MPTSMVPTSSGSTSQALSGAPLPSSLGDGFVVSPTSHGSPSSYGSEKLLDQVDERLSELVADCQFDSNTSKTAKPNTASLATFSSASADSANNASTAPSATADSVSAPYRLIDWNSFAPDGTVASLHQVLFHLGQVTGVQLWGGVSDNGSWIFASSQPQSHREEQLSAALRAAIIEASSVTSACLFAFEDQQSSMLLQSVRNERSAEIVLSFGVPCKAVELGLLFVVGQKTSSISQDRISKLIQQIRKEMAVWIELWYLCWLGAKSNSWYSRCRKLYKNRRTWMLAAAVCLGAMAVPVPYWPQRECIVEPASRRFLTSPVAGRVIEAQVRPGDVVESGQLLARIDDQQLRWELANVEADYQKACKKHDSALASRSGGDLRMAQLEREQFAIQIELLQSKLQQLEIRSPIAGVVVDGDWVPTSGSTVERADTLFEIAPLDSMRVRTLLSTEDLGRIATGTPLTIRVDSAQGKKWTGKVERIDPRGRLEGSEVVFEAETFVENDQNALRPGMRGSTRLTSDWHSIGWMIFYRPYTWLMKKFAW